MRVRAVLPLVLALTLPFTAACGSSGDEAGASGTVVVRIPDPGNDGYLAAAKKDGSFDAALKKVHARVQWAGDFPTFAPAAQAINSGSLDLAIGSITSAIAALSVKPSFKIFAVIPPDRAGEGIIVKNGSPIKSVADLAGRSVAVGKGGSSEYLLLKALETFNVPVDKVKRVYLPPGETAAVFGSGKVDAWATFSTFLAPAVTGLDARILVDGGQIKSDNYALWVASNKVLDAHPDVVKAVFGFLKEGSAKEIADPAAYQNVFTSTGPQAASGALKDKLVAIREQGEPVKNVEQADVTRFDSVAKFFLDQKVITAPLEVAQYTVDVSAAS
ncbi:NrtA/SsuA/CpmA family ABC transporter substrate-binding protein [Actinocorallia longicatena]|uniref:Sulfonate ABC transporter substrate-binding protein n=1 Tax=Actinocorallia longicatena TaxID=111803 RepID=A0ABP6QAQ6_9ACTN